MYFFNSDSLTLQLSSESLKPVTLFIVYKYVFLFSGTVILEYLKGRPDIRSADKQVGKVLNLGRVNITRFLPGNLVAIEDAIS